MPTSRPSLAIAGVAGFALLAGLVFHLTSIAPPSTTELALGPASVGEPGADAGTADSLEREVSVAEATDETSAGAEAVRGLAAGSSRAGSGESGSEREFGFYRLLPAQSPPSAADSESAPGRPGDRTREQSIDLTRVAPPAAPSAAERVEPSRSRSLAHESRPTPSPTYEGGGLAIAGPTRAVRSMAEAGERFEIAAADSEILPADAHREQGRDRFANIETNPVKVVAEEPVSTFSIDVDTASYGFVRASLNHGVLPQVDAVRVEELVNYFPYDYPGPESRETPFRASVSLLPAPWNPAARLMHIGIRGYALDTGTAPRANLVFLVDVSGSMDEPNKLPLVVNSLKLLLGTLAPEDTVAIVVYAGAAGTVLPPTPVAERGRVLAALEQLDAGGSTAGAEGIRQAYLLAERHFVEGGVNRVILATDGDFNVGITDTDELESFIARKRESGVFLSVLGFGMGNYDDALMQRLAQHGNGNAAYIDSLNEARKALVDEATSMLFPIANDVKIQVEFNPAAVSEYRLIGYETRMLAREDFRNDRVDAGEIGSGHTVTAIYEVVPVGSGAEQLAPLRYQRGEAAETDTEFGDELAFLKIRYKRPDADTSILITRAVTTADAVESVDAAPSEARFAAAVAGFGQLLRGGRHTGDYGYDDVIVLAQGARGEDPFGYRAEFISLVRLAKSAAAIEPLAH